MVEIADEEVMDEAHVFQIHVEVVLRSLISVVQSQSYFTKSLMF